MSVVERIEARGAKTRVSKKKNWCFIFDGRDHGAFFRISRGGGRRWGCREKIKRVSGCPLACPQPRAVSTRCCFICLVLGRHLIWLFSVAS